MSRTKGTKARRHKGTEWAIAIFFLLTACGPENPGASTNGAGGDTVLLQSASEGQVTLKVGSDSKDFTAGKSATITIQSQAPQGVSVQLGDYAKALNEGENRFAYRVTEVHAGTPTISNGTVQWSNTYKLEFILPGDYDFPPATAMVSDTAVAASGTANSNDHSAPIASVPDKPIELKTESFKVTVREAGSAPSEEDLQKIPKLTPVELPSPWRIWRWVIAATAATLVVIALILLRRWRAKKLEEVIIIPAHEWARQQIAELTSDDLIAKGRVQEFFYRISDILRGYIERRFHVAAPEMTTEEFLNKTTTDRRFGETDRRELVEFMNACDEVKYARHEPTTAESNAVVDAAITYIERTRERLFESNGSATGTAQLKGQAA